MSFGRHFGIGLAGRRLLRAGATWVGVLGLVWLTAGCAGYRLGPTGDLGAGDRSVQFNPVLNQTLEPGLAPAVNSCLRKAVQRDGSFRLSTHGEGDIVVRTEITHYRRRGIAFQSYDTLTTQDYELTIEATVVATERHSGREMVNTTVTSRTTIRAGTDLASMERQALPLLADELARRIAGVLADGKW